MVVQELDFAINLSETKLREVMDILLGLQLQGDITAESYGYLNDQLLYVLRDLVHPFLYGDIEEFDPNEGEEDGSV
jgi:hypothetical protein